MSMASQQSTHNERPMVIAANIGQVVKVIGSAIELSFQYGEKEQPAQTFQLRDLPTVFASFSAGQWFIARTENLKNNSGYVNRIESAKPTTTPIFSHEERNTFWNPSRKA
jgi:hypothetical protein